MTNLNIGEPNFDPSGVIHVIEEGIQVEKLILEANKIIQNDTAWIQNEQRVTSAEMLLCLLRRDHPLG